MTIISKRSGGLKIAINTAKKFVKTTYNTGCAVETEITKKEVLNTLKQKHTFVNLINNVYVINDIQETIEIITE